MVHQVGETPKITINLKRKDGTVLDISDKDVHTWYIEKPDDTEFTLTLTDVTVENASNGIVSTRVDKTDFDIVGWYKIHVYIKFTDGYEYYSDLVEHQVKALYT